MTPLERAASALQTAWDGGEAEGLPPIAFSETEARYLARAVLQAIREPSEGMLEAGKEDSGIDGYVNDFWPIVPWQAMIDAALSE